jgi:isochorismate pyruvate lyase
MQPRSDDETGARLLPLLRGTVRTHNEVIDTLDCKILPLLRRRARYVEAAARFKSNKEAVRAPNRQRAMLAERRRWAEAEGLDPDSAEGLYKAIVAHFVGREMRYWRREGRADDGAGG